MQALLAAAGLLLASLVQAYLIIAASNVTRLQVWSWCLVAQPPYFRESGSASDCLQDVG